MFVKSKGNREDELRSDRREKQAMEDRDDKRKQPPYEAFKSKVKGLEDAVFESGSVEHAAQFVKTLEEIADYVQKNDQGRGTSSF